MEYTMKCEKRGNEGNLFLSEKIQKKDKFLPNYSKKILKIKNKYYHNKEVIY